MIINKLLECKKYKFYKANYIYAYIRFLTSPNYSLYNSILCLPKYRGFFN